MTVVSRAQAGHLVFHERAWRQWGRLEQGQREAAIQRLGETAVLAARSVPHPNVHALGENKPNLPRAFYTDVTHHRRNARLFFTLDSGLLCLFMVEDGYDNTSKVRGRTEEMARRSLTFREDVRDGQRLINGPTLLSVAGELPPPPAPRPIQQQLLQPLQPIEAAPPEEQPEPPPTEPAPSFPIIDILPRNGYGYPDAMALRALARYEPNVWVSLHEEHLDGECIRRLCRAGLANAEVTTSARMHYARITDKGRAAVSANVTRIRYKDDDVHVFYDPREDPNSPQYIGNFLTKQWIVRSALECTTSGGDTISDSDLWELLDTRDQRLIADRASLYNALRDLVRYGLAETARPVGATQDVYSIARQDAPAASVKDEPQQQTQEQQQEEAASMTTKTSSTTPVVPEPESAKESPRAVVVREAEAFCDALGSSFRHLSRDERTLANTLLSSVEDFIDAMKRGGA